jgi:hypothetical protein
MTEEEHRKWDIVFKWLGLLGVLGGAAWTVHTYLESRTKDQNSFIFERQAVLYLDATRAAATIATAFDPDVEVSKAVDAKTLQTERERFEQLYLGELVSVEDRRVELAMIAFRECLLRGGKNCIRTNLDQFEKPMPKETVDRLGPADLHHFSLDLAACVRSALQEDRKIQFGEAKSPDTFCP